MNTPHIYIYIYIYICICSNAHIEYLLSSAKAGTRNNNLSLYMFISLLLSPSVCVYTYIYSYIYIYIYIYIYRQFLSFFLCHIQSISPDRVRWANYHHFRLLISRMCVVCFRFCLLCSKLESVEHCLCGKQNHDAVHSSRNLETACCTPWHLSEAVVVLYLRPFSHMASDSLRRPTLSIWRW